jgi:hypothetical protein
MEFFQHIFHRDENVPTPTGQQIENIYPISLTFAGSKVKSTSQRSNNLSHNTDLAFSCEKASLKLWHRGLLP